MEMELCQKGLVVLHFKIKDQLSAEQRGNKKRPFTEFQLATLAREEMRRNSSSSFSWQH